MRRRRACLVLGACAAPWHVRAQASAAPARIGWLTSVPITSWPLYAAFTAEMRDLGWVEGVHFMSEAVSYDGRSERIEPAVAELVRRKPDLIIVGGTLPVRPMMQSTSTIPIVMFATADPVGQGFVAKLARPGGNVTGLSSLDHGMLGKQFELLMEAAPQARRVGVVFNPDIAPHLKGLGDVEPFAGRLGVQVRPTVLRAPAGIDAAVQGLDREQVQAVHVFVQPFLNTGGHAGRIAALALQRRWPSVLGDLEHVRAGILVAYGWRLEDLVRRLPYYVDRILKGTPAGELPIEQPARFYTWVNQRTARSLGLELPRPLLLRADEVID